LIAIAFMAVTTIVFMLPAQRPVTPSNMSKLSTDRRSRHT
jgi:hypothetical protein